MEYFLVVDTSSDYGLCALMDSEETLHSLRYFKANFSHSEKLFSSIDEVLIETTRKLADIHSIYYVAGPGSFTGLRIAYSALMGFSKTTNIKIKGVSSFDVYFENLIDFNFSKIVLIKSSSLDIFANIKNKDGVDILEAASYKKTFIESYLNQIEEKHILLGDTENLNFSNDKIIKLKNKSLSLISPYSILKAGHSKTYDDILYLKDSFKRV